MNRMMAIIEREMRKFFRSPTLMFASMVFPLVQLIVLGNAFGGKIRDAKMGVVDEDHGTQAIRIKEAFDAVRANMRTFIAIPYDNEVQAREDVRNGKIQGAVIIPAQYSKLVYEKNHPRIALIVDNSDNFMSSTLEDELTNVTNALNQPDVQPRLLQQTALEVVELYPYIEYMKYLLPGSITLAMFVSVMIGGGMLYIDDKARGVHEGYLVTPITKTELVLGSGGDQGGDDRGGDYGSRVAAGGSGDDIQSGNDAGAPGDDRTDLGGVQFNDVLVDGADRGSSGTAGDVWNSEYTAVFSQRIDLSDRSVSEVAAGDCEGGSVYVRGAWIQVAAAEGNGVGGDCSRHDLSVDICGGDAGAGSASI